MSSTSSAKLNRIIRAGAGAGKTHNLVETVYGILVQSNSKSLDSKIVVTTFTRKAAQELKERLLLKALTDGDLGLVKKISSPNTLHISTIHGVLSRFLSQEGHWMGIPPQFAMMDDFEELLQIKRLLRKSVESNSKVFSEVLEEYRFGELSIILKDLMRSLLFDGDKLPLTVEDQIKSLIQELADFGEQAEFLSQQILKETDKDSWTTFAKAMHQMGSQCRNVDGDSIFKRIEELVSHWDALPRVANRGEVVSPSTVQIKAELKKRLELMSSNRSSLSYFEKQEKFARDFHQIASSLAEDFLKQKLERAAFTMQDLEDVSWLLINAFPQAAKKFSENWTHWFIDELQDTSPRQMRILDELSRGSPQYLVGDPQQSIYLFRGARTEVFQNKLDEVQSAGGEVGILMKNYRSHPNVIKFINQYFRAFGSGFQSMEVGFSKEPKASEVMVLIAKDTEDKHSDDPTSASLDGELKAILHRIQQLIHQGADPGQICVLSRDNQSLQNLALAARSLGLETVLHSSGKYSERVEVVDALTLLKFLVNPHDNLNLLQLLRSPWWRLSDNELILCAQKKPISYWSALAVQFPSNEIILRLQSLLVECQTHGISETWIKAMMESKFIDSALHLDPSGRREANIWKLVFLLKQKERSVGFSYLKFLEELTEIDLESNAEADATPVLDPGKVNLMTVHASKGLQFEHVIVIGMGKAPRKPRSSILIINEEDKKFALSLSDAETQKREHSLAVKAWIDAKNEAESQESLRVLYVAMTRAIYTLSLIWSENPAEDSWAGAFPLNLEPGNHQIPESKYEVRHDDFSILPFQTIGSKAVEVRKLWKELSVNQKNLGVTEMLEESAKTDKNLSALSSAHSIQLAQRGTEVHRQFENLKYGRFQLQKLQAQSQLDFVFKWGNGRLLQIIDSGFVEWSFVLQAPWGPVQGQIDLWGADQSGTYWVVDYKTGSSKYSEKAMKQLKFYLYALRELGKIPSDANVQLAVLYLNEGKILEAKAPEQLALLQELQIIDPQQNCVTD